MRIVNKKDAGPRDAVAEADEKDVSGQLVRVIDFLFALVIVQGALGYRTLLEADGERSVAGALALVLVMYTVVRSFIDWHILMERAPYQILSADKLRGARWPWRTLEVRTVELVRLYADFLIVAAYSVLLLRGHVLLSSPGDPVRFFFWVFAAVFVLYLVWGELLRRSSGGQQRFEEGLLILASAASLVLAGVYAVGIGCLGFSGEAWNLTALAGAALIMAGYRHLNWKQHETVVAQPPSS